MEQLKNLIDLKIYKIYYNKISNITIEKHYWQILSIILLLILILIGSNYFIKNEQVKIRIEAYNHYKSFLDDNKNAEKYLIAQLFLNDCMYNLQMNYPDVKRKYNNDHEFKQKIERIHDIGYYIQKNDMKNINMFYMQYKTPCKKSYVLDLYSSFIGTIKFIPFNEGKKQLLTN